MDQNLLSQEPYAMYTLNSYCAMEPMKLYILKNKLVTGPPYVFQAKTSLTTYNMCFHKIKRFKVCSDGNLHQNKMIVSVNLEKIGDIP